MQALALESIEENELSDLHDNNNNMKHRAKKNAEGFKKMHQIQIENYQPEQDKYFVT